MLKSCQILFRTIALGAIAVVGVGCGQRGALYLPTEAAAANRATLPQTLDPTGRSTASPETPAAATAPAPSAPASQPKQ